MHMQCRQQACVNPGDWSYYAKITMSLGLTDGLHFLQVVIVLPQGGKVRLSFVVTTENTNKNFTVTD